MVKSVKVADKVAVDTGLNGPKDESTKKVPRTKKNLEKALEVVEAKMKEPEAPVAEQALAKIEEAFGPLTEVDPVPSSEQDAYLAGIMNREASALTSEEAPAVEKKAEDTPPPPPAPEAPVPDTSGLDTVLIAGITALCKGAKADDGTYVPVGTLKALWLKGYASVSGKGYSPNSQAIAKFNSWKAPDEKKAVVPPKARAARDPNAPKAATGGKRSAAFKGKKIWNRCTAYSGQIAAGRAVCFFIVRDNPGITYEDYTAKGGNPFDLNFLHLRGYLTFEEVAPLATFADIPKEFKVI